MDTGTRKKKARINKISSSSNNKDKYKKKHGAETLHFTSCKTKGKKKKREARSKNKRRKDRKKKNNISRKEE